MYNVDVNKIYNRNACIYTAIGKIDSHLEVGDDIIICYSLYGMLEPNEYLRVPYIEARATVLRVRSDGQIVWRIEAPDKGEFTYIYIDKEGKYRAATSGYEIYYFDPETGKTQGWDYE